MKPFQLGLMIAIALLGVWFSTLWAMAQSATPDADTPPATLADEATPPDDDGAEASAVDQQLGLLITATVGTVAGACATTRTIQVVANTPLYYCYTLRNTGSEALTVHNLQSSRGNVNRNLDAFRLEPNAQRVFSTTIKIGNDDLSLVDNTGVDVTNYVTWTARASQDSSSQVVATSNAVVDVVNPSINVVKTVGQERNVCGASQALMIPSGQAASFCISIQNTGDITFTRHALTDTQLSIIRPSFNYTLAPGSTLAIFYSNITTILGQEGGSLERNITSRFVNDVSVAAYTASGISATGVSTASVDIGTSTARITKTVSTAADNCGGSNSIEVAPGTEVYYCVILENTGEGTLTKHQLQESYLSIDFTFDYPLAPGERLYINNDFLARNNLPIVFGPFEIHPRYGGNLINNTMTYIGTSSEGYNVTASAVSSFTYAPTPTVTATSRATATYTPIVGPTLSPTPSPTEPTPTPTFTDTPTPETPTVTPTRSYAISLLETPTPRTQIAGIPGVPNEQAPTPDPNQPQPQPGSDGLPVQNPDLATATQVAVDATATTIMLEAIAAQATMESAQATALAEALATLPVPMPESPLATPTPPLMDTPTPLPIEVTVLPPVETVVTGPILVTETPEMMMIVVTSTPLSGESPQSEMLPEGQRPIVYPTPTSTPDLVMAAARTFDVAVTTFGWIWFLVGSLIFFVTTGIVAGLFFRQADEKRFDLPDPEYWLEEDPKANPSPTRRGTPQSGGPQQGAARDDDWPADLP